MNQTYRIQNWSNGYFSIEDSAVSLNVANEKIALNAIAESLESHHLDWPVVVRFPQILRAQSDRFYDAFTAAFKKSASEKLDYQAIYPIKVNQHRSVVETLLDANPKTGLECGSKPELIACLAACNSPRTMICNGYKDRAYAELACSAAALGHTVFWVIEKPSDYDLMRVVRRAVDLPNDINLAYGARVRLNIVGGGNWQNTGGESAKFGLNAKQLLALVGALEKNDDLEDFQLLHAHMGSQISALDDFEMGLRELARFLVELQKLGAPIDRLDVGGGVGIDYDGTQSDNYFSLDYSLEKYATTIARVLLEAGTENLTILTECGRAMTAHHAVLLTNIIDTEITETIDTDAQEKLRADFVSGDLSLDAFVENIHQNSTATHTKLFANLSLFQSLPDAWGLGQVFPILPLQLSQSSDTKITQVVIHDLTCDSDGTFKNYVTDSGTQNTLPIQHISEQLTAGDLPIFGFFLIGAYQEILGDVHNLFGAPHTVDVIVDGQEIQLKNLERGETVKDLLEMVHFETNDFWSRIDTQLAQSNLDKTTQKALRLRLQLARNEYSYLLKS